MPIVSPWQDLKVPDVSLTELLLDRIQTYGDEVALIDGSCGGKSLTFKQVYNQVRNCAGYLYEQGLRKRDVVALCASNCLEFPIVMLGVMACGATVSLCNPIYTRGEIFDQFKLCHPTMVIATEEAAETAESVAQELGYIKKIIIIGQSEKYVTTSYFLESHSDFPKHVCINSSQDVAILAYSSGTTGLPKGVLITHRSIVMITKIFSFSSNLKSGECIYSDQPMIHAFGYETMLVSLFIGCKLVFTQKCDIAKMLKLVQEYKVNKAVITPPILVNLGKTDMNIDFDISSLKTLICEGSPLPPQLIREVEDRYQVNVEQIYAMTECGIIAYNQTSDREESVGGPCPNTTMKVVDLQTGEEVEANVDGEILVKALHVMSAYLNNPESTNESIDKDGWLHTGDIGHVDNEGMFYVVGRFKEVIKYKTRQVPPAEIESVILKHPKVTDVGVVGIPDINVGEIPKAFVVKKDESLTEKEIVTLVQKELSDYKHLRGGVDFVAAIPKSPNGKIQRIELKKMAGEL